MNELHASRTVASNVRKRRLELGWSMRRLAERSGMPEDVIEAIENGRRRRGVTIDELLVLADALGVHWGALVDGDDYRVSGKETGAVKHLLLADMEKMREALDVLRRYFAD